MTSTMKALRFGLLAVITGLNFFLLLLFWGIVLENTQVSPLLVSLGITGGLLWLALSQPGDAYFRFLCGYRKPTPDELAYLTPIMQEVIRSVPDNAVDYIDLAIQDSDELNAYASGRHTICLTTGTLQAATRQELFGVIAHEMGHLHNGDSVIMLIAAVMNTIGTFAVWGLTIIMLFFGKLIEAFMPSAKWILLAEVWVLKGIAWLAFKALDLGMKYTNREAEHAADKFAAKIGYRDGLIGFLKRLYRNSQARKQNYQPQTSFNPRKALLAALTDTHPPLPDRLRALGVEVD